MKMEITVIDSLIAFMVANGIDELNTTQRKGNYKVAVSIWEECENESEDEE